MRNQFKSNKALGKIFIEIIPLIKEVILRRYTSPTTFWKVPLGGKTPQFRRKEWFWNQKKNPEKFDNIIVSSFHHDKIKRLQELEPKLKLALLTDSV